MISPIENSPAAMAYLKRIGATLRSIFTANITVLDMGYERETVKVKFDRSGTVKAPYGYEPTAEEIVNIAAQVSAINFPTQQSVKSLSPSNMPEMMRQAQSSHLFIYYNKEGEVNFVQVRLDLDNGDKRYVPWTYWSDGEWRKAEPEGKLPIYGLEGVRQGDRVFLHEGAKAAKAAREIAENPRHPWHQFFSTGSHVGWIGGVHHLGRSDWSSLSQPPGELIAVPDNDFAGKVKVSEIMKRFKCPSFYLMLDNRWPKAWDVADPLPEAMYKVEKLETGEEIKHYIGPDPQELLEPCDWATEEVEFFGDEAPRNPVFKIRNQFAQNWVRIQNVQMYAHMHFPDRTYNKDQFNAQVRPYSDVDDTARLLHKISGNLAQKLTFRPDMPTGLIRVDGDLSLNQYIDQRIKPKTYRGEGRGTGPFWRFMQYLFPNEEERLSVTRWMATLYARPQTRMGFGLLLLSKLQGVGKSTFLNILAEMIGRRHSSFPGDSMIQSDFNGWIVNKRLIVVHEIYAGQNWKVYNRLKSLITESLIEANNKHVANYQLPNWSHFAAASNSMEALRIETDDRRWYVPLLPTYLYGGYAELYDWIDNGGLNYLADELLSRNDYLTEGDQAPQTAAKLALIDQSMPNDERMLLYCAQRMRKEDCLDTTELWLWLQSEANLRGYVSPQRLSSLLQEHGFYVEKEAKIGLNSREVIWRSHEDFLEATRGKTEDEISRIRADRIRVPSDVFSDTKVM